MKQQPTFWFTAQIIIVLNQTSFKRCFKWKYKRAEWFSTKRFWTKKNYWCLQLTSFCPQTDSVGLLPSLYVGSDPLILVSAYSENFLYFMSLFLWSLIDVCVEEVCHVIFIKKKKCYQLNVNYLNMEYGIPSIFWFVFFGVWTEYGYLLSWLSPYSVRIWEITDQGKLCIRIILTQWSFPIIWTPLNWFPKKLIVVNIWLEHKWMKVTEI